MLIDSGAHDDVVDETTYNSWTEKPWLRKSKVRLFSYCANEPLRVLGEIDGTILANGRVCRSSVKVVSGSAGCLLSCLSSRRLGLFQTAAFNEICKVVAANEYYSALLSEYDTVFTEKVGKLKGYKVKLHVDRTITPKQQPYRRVPYHLAKPIEKELDKLIENDVIEAIEKPSEWVSALVAVPKPKKPGEVRLTIDSRLANKAIKSIKYVTPTTEEIAYDLNGSTVFSRIDLNKAFHQLELDEGSRDITTFVTHRGFYRFRRLHMGVASASQEFGHVLQHKVLSGLEGVRNIADDIIVYGKTREEHDTLLERMRKCGLTSSGANCELGAEEITFFGLKLSKNGVALNDDKVEALLKAATRIAHEGHLGVVKTKSLMRTKVWFPGLDSRVESMVDQCLACKVEGRGTVEPMKSTIMPDRPWEFLCMDFFGPLPNGKELLVLMDEFSRLPIVEEIKTTASDHVIPVLDSIFSLLGIPVEVKTDNGPPFNGSKFKEFSEYLGFRHRKITPLLPQANGQCESFMKNLGKVIRGAITERREWKGELNKFLRNYRSVPHSTTGIASSVLMFNRNKTSRLPDVGNAGTEFELKDAKQRDEQLKWKSKVYTDKRRRAKAVELKVGDEVLARQKRTNKWVTRFGLAPMSRVP